MIRGVIFDLDGVLLDSLGIWQDLGARYLRSMGFVPEEGLGQTLFSMSFEDGCAYLQRKYRPSRSAEGVRKDLEALLRRFYCEEAQACPGALTVLEMLREHRIPIVLATSTPRELAESALRRLGFLPYFRAMLTVAEVGSDKHSPVIFLRGAEILGAEPGEILVFEDSLYALKTAGDAGFRTAGVYASKGEADQAGLRLSSDRYLFSLADLDPAQILDV